MSLELNVLDKLSEALDTMSEELKSRFEKKAQQRFSALRCDSHQDYAILYEEYKDVKGYIDFYERSLKEKYLKLAVLERVLARLEEDEA